LLSAGCLEARRDGVHLVTIQIVGVGRQRSSGSFHYQPLEGRDLERHLTARAACNQF